MLINSSLIEQENSVNPFPERKLFVEEVMTWAKIYQNANEQIRKRAAHLERAFKITSIDALHVAAAEEASADFFVTCDHASVKKYKGILTILTPLQFISRYASQSP